MKLTPDCDVFVSQKSSTGQELVDAVCEHLSLTEKDYFSCSYKDRHGVRVSYSPALLYTVMYCLFFKMPHSGRF